ncbi:MAG: helix-turn-helix domain-containing protein [Marmoricola sp.]
MNTLEISGIPVQQLDELDAFAATVGPELRDVLLSLSRCVRDGDRAVVVDGSDTLTPTQVAQRLGMSRTHLYKLLDRGEIMFHRVGRDRRIRVEDLRKFEAQRQMDRRELAERFAHQHQTAIAATDEIADLL